MVRQWHCVDACLLPASSSCKPACTAWMQACFLVQASCTSKQGARASKVHEQARHDEAACSSCLDELVMLRRACILLHLPSVLSSSNNTERLISCLAYKLVLAHELVTLVQSCTARGGKMEKWNDVLCGIVCRQHQTRPMTQTSIRPMTPNRALRVFFFCVLALIPFRGICLCASLRFRALPVFFSFLFSSYYLIADG